MNESISLTRPVTIAIITDIHYGKVASPLPSRQTQVADILLKRTVARLNRLIHPDVTLVLGDLLDNGDYSEAEKDLLHIKSILDELNSPYIAIPGNHDGDTKQFYKVIPRPKDIQDICGIRFLSFIDQEEPGYNAHRSSNDLARFKIARHNYDGPIVSLQHVCLFPENQAVAPYNYTNSAEIISAMKEANVLLSLSGHHHEGAENTKNNNTTFVNAPGLCEAPFPFTVLRMDNNEITTERHELAMPNDLKLIDRHVHTNLAYCNDNMTVEQAIHLGHLFGLNGMIFTEHSSHLYFERGRVNTIYQPGGMNTAKEEESRMAEYLEMKQKYENDWVKFGMELDCDYQGNLAVFPKDRAHFDFTIGAMHSLPALSKDNPVQQSDKDDFLWLLEKMLTKRINAVAHPFRVFRRSGWTPPAELFEPTAQLLRKHNVVAEINFHTNEPPVEFIRTCLNEGVKFSFGSDSHHLSEIGDFAYQLALLKDAGFNGDLSDILI